jgi:hypothetical protein
MMLCLYQRSRPGRASPFQFPQCGSTFVHQHYLHLVRKRPASSLHLSWQFVRPCLYGGKEVFRAR